MRVKDNLRTLIFAAVLALVCSLLLATASHFTTPFREANEQAEQVRNFLAALEIPVDDAADAKTLLAIYEQNVRVKTVGELTLYEYVPEAGDGKPRAVALPFEGPGLWAGIRGVMALEPDLVTIRGVRFYQQEETPGLGGDIGADWFQKQFVKKRVVSADGTPGFRVLKPGGTADANAVDGITGATMTCDLVQDMLVKLTKALAQVRSEYVN